MTLEIHKVAKEIQAAGIPPAGSASGWSVDTRTQSPGDVYFALRGPHHDGHDFLRTASGQGAAALVVEKSYGLPGELLVNDTLCGLQTLGSWARKEWGGTVIGVTGSAGKTTTKDAIAHLLAAEMPTGKTVGNFN